MLYIYYFMTQIIKFNIIIDIEYIDNEKIGRYNVMSFIIDKKKRLFLSKQPHYNLNGSISVGVSNFLIKFYL